MTSQTRSCGARRAAAPLAAAWLLAAACLAGAAGAPDESRVLANLLKLHGDRVPMLYSPGSLDRAAHLQQRLDAVAKDVQNWSGITLDVRGVVLSSDDWQALHIPVPYGLPQWTTVGLAAPAWGDQHSVALWHGLIGSPLPWGGGDPLRGSRDEAASVALADTLLQVECSRLAAARAITVAGPDWIHELLSHVIALTAVAVHENERAAELDAVYAALGAHLPAPGGIRAYAAAADYRVRLAYQPVFHRGAEIVVAKGGRKAAWTLLHVPKKNGGQLTEGDLIKHFPGLREWIASASAAAPAAAPPTAH